MDTQVRGIGIMPAEGVRTAMIIVVVEFHVARTVAHERRRPRYETPESLVGARVREKFPEAFAAHPCTVSGTAVGIAVVTLAYMREHILEIHAFARIELAIPVIERKAKTYLRQECRLPQITGGKGPEQRQVWQELVFQI